MNETRKIYNMEVITNNDGMVIGRYAQDGNIDFGSSAIVQRPFVARSFGGETYYENATGRYSVNYFRNLVKRNKITWG
ncbi:MAG: hypothetical protein MJZ20_04970 [Bacteroidaceae bacterium]|nr:hypothetical protein [Bacteroidaceae bacterium]